MSHLELPSYLDQSPQVKQRFDRLKARPVTSPEPTSASAAPSVNGAGHLVVGRVILLHIDPAVVGADGHVEAASLRAVGRMGTDLWVRSRDTFPMPRPE